MLKDIGVKGKKTRNHKSCLHFTKMVENLRSVSSAIYP